MKDGETQVVALVVLSGRPQPAPEVRAVRVRVPVVVRTQGRGPPRVVVEGPDGAGVTTADAPFVRDGATTGTEQRFTPVAAGAYRLVLGDSPTTVLAILDAR